MLQFNKPSRQCITEPFSAGGRARPSFTLHLFDIYDRVLDVKMNISPHNRTATVWRPLGQESDNILLRAGEVNSAGGYALSIVVSTTDIGKSNFNIYVVKTFVLRHSHIQSFIYFGWAVHLWTRFRGSFPPRQCEINFNVSEGWKTPPTIKCLRLIISILELVSEYYSNNLRRHT